MGFLFEKVWGLRFGLSLWGSMSLRAWVVIGMVISPLMRVTILVTLLIAPFITTHEPFWGAGFGYDLHRLKIVVGFRV